VQNRDHTWANVRRGSVAPAHSAEVAIGGLASGEYRIEQWDTHAGRVVAAALYRSSDGTVMFTTPAELVGDVAYAVRAMHQ